MRIYDTHHVDSILQDFCKWLLQQNKSKSTVNTYIGVLQKFFQWLNEHNYSLSKLTNHEVQEYMDYLDQLNRSPVTIEKYYTAISVFSRFQGIPQVMLNVKRKEKEKSQDAPESLDPNEQKLLLKKVAQDNDFRNMAIVYTLLHTGIKVSELCALNQSDIKINKHGGCLIVRLNNGEISRTIPLSKEVCKYLQNYMNSRTTKQEALFISSVNKRITPRSVQYMLKKYNINPHKLRHTFCQELINNGIDLRVVSKLAGHKDINVTKRYFKELHYDPYLEQAIEKTF